MFLTFSALDQKALDRISSEAAENTAMIIGIVAGALIAVILVVLLVLKFMNRNNGTRKTVDDKSFSGSGGGRKMPGGGQSAGSNTALLNAQLNAAAVPGQYPQGPNRGPLVSAGNSAAAASSNLPFGAMVPLDKKLAPVKKPDRDIKEWYV